MCGPFLGYFPDKHVSPENSDESSDSDEEVLKAEGRAVILGLPTDTKGLKKMAKGLPTDTKGLKKLTKKKGNLAQSLQATILEQTVGGAVWTPYMINTTIEVEHADSKVQLPVQGVQAVSQPIPKSFMDKLETISQIYIFDLTSCGIDDLPDEFVREFKSLMVVRLSHNKLRQLKKESFDAGAGKSSAMKELMLEHNRLTHISVGALSRQNVERLMVLDLSHNQLEILPMDFLAGAVELKFLDLSNNGLKLLPSSILQCTKLMIFHASSNALKELPEVGHFRDLRKLFVSNNNLSSMPENIGNCVKLVKLRLYSNHVRFLPRSSVKLWKENGGRLEELLIAGNPMIQPSITAYEFGGIDQCMKLFQVWVENEENAEANLLAEGEAKYEAERLEAAKRGDTRGFTSPSFSESRSDDARPETPAGLLEVKPEYSAKGMAPREIVLSSGEPAAGDMAAVDAGPKVDEPGDFYVPKGERLPAELMQRLRNVQAAMLLRKRKSFVDQRVKDEIERAELAAAAGEPVPDECEPYLRNEVDTTTYAGAIPASDVDKLFIMLVYSVKPLYQSCSEIFDFFKNQHSDRMELTEWEIFCKRAPIRISPAMQAETFRTLCVDSDDFCNRLTFFSACQIHDIELKDPWVRCMANALRLEYLEVTPEQLGREMAEKAEFVDVKDEVLRSHDRSFDQQVEDRYALRSKAKDAAQQALNSSGAPFLVSLNDMEYALARGERDGASDSPRSSGTYSSAHLSIEEETQDTTFDAVERMEEMALMEKELHPDSSSAQQKEASKAFVVQSDMDLKALMEMPPELVGIEDEIEEKKVSSTKRSSSKQRDRGKFWSRGKSKGVVVDPRFTTDMLSVRQSLREAKRNLPEVDYRALINFLVRSLRIIKYTDSQSITTYWNCEDPVFKRTMRVNRYTESVLWDMGFVFVNDTYWVWPLEHMHSNAEMGDWGHLVLPRQCPGSQQGRLDDVLQLLCKMQRQIAKFKASEPE